MSVRRWLGGAAAFLAALAALSGAAWLVSPEAWLEAAGLAAEPAPAAATTGGWGAAPAPPVEPPLVDVSGLAWMAWTPETGAFFLGILAALSTMIGVEIVAPGGGPRQGVFGITTTRGDRLFITLLGSAYILLAWLGLAGAPVWGGVGLALAWGVFVFWKV